MSDTSSLTQAIQRYFDLVYDGDVARFDQVFRPTAQLHGYWNGEMTLLSAQAFKESLASRPTPKSLNARREDAVLLVDFASDDQALTKVRVRTAAAVFIDYLTWHRIDGDWRVTSKGFHVERLDPLVASPA
ncbi:nuclear transport factor 2 family protein [Reyranella sp. CPCC 100927]|uniref:nuclear transport factor 2 family protein n=1 Tax=Reyranella sp. CPCC 100927 TaxID=2599616 RepID=UPI0011B52EB3|nr:nuclear transport factor 2 family protein [Reyranella sp. CPCC 100927]TWT00324.1 nuclear transport factor 2 family protein [Reyranella sp. CPCC 100927]